MVQRSKNTVIFEGVIHLILPQAVLKRTFDLVLSAFGLALLWWLVLLAWLLASIDTRSNGFFVQKRVGRYGKLFNVVKIKTMRQTGVPGTTITAANDPRITRFGALLRKTKIDELPQLFNVFLGQMSFVGPRPDVPGYADKLTGDDRIVLSIRPGITGPATLKYKYEEELLAQQEDPRAYNDNVIFPDKVAINKAYIDNYSFLQDIRYILQTVFD
ncbi:MAG: sugar transferase [Colwellia sp.]|nr:sugar transferase [Colwellia sp.]